MTSPVAIQLNIGQGPFAAPFGPGLFHSLILAQLKLENEKIHVLLDK
jgi:hypothetical protein